MKKKTMVLGGLIAAVAITGYSVAGTYARYVTKVGGGEIATVAKWDVTTNGTMTLFGHPGNGAIVDGRVAPGGTGTGSFGVTIGNDMEVEFAVDAGDTKLDNQVLLVLTVLNAGETKPDNAPVTTITAEEKAALATEKRILEKDGNVYYAPIQFTLNGGTSTNDITTLVNDIKTALEGITKDNKTLANQTIAWSWKKDAETTANAATKELVNALDTKLGTDGTATLEITATAIVKQAD